MKRFNKISAVILVSLLFCQSSFAAWPSVSARTKTWGAEVLTAADFHGQFDLIHTYINAMMNASTGHGHTGSTNDGPKLNIAAALTIASQAQGDIIYASSGSAFARLGAGTSGQFLQTLGAAANPVWATAPQATRGSFNNLYSVWASNSTATVTATDLIVYDSSNNGFIINSYSKTADMAVSGAGGLDTGAEAANTIYYLWAIRKSADGTNNILVSTSSSAPTMPSGYDQKALVSCVGNNNSSNFIKFHQRGRVYTFDTWATMASGNAGASWVAIDLTPANMTTNAGFVPSTMSNFCFGSINSDACDISLTNDNSVATSVSTITPNKFSIEGNTNLQYMLAWQFDIITTDTLYWLSSAAGATIYLHGFIIDLLT